MERERERLTLSFDLDLPEEARRREASTELIRPTRSRDFGLSLPSFSLESTFLAGLRLFDRDWRRLRRSPPDEDDDEEEELLLLDESELDELELKWN